MIAMVGPLESNCFVDQSHFLFCVGRQPAQEAFICLLTRRFRGMFAAIVNGLNDALVVLRMARAWQCHPNIVTKGMRRPVHPLKGPPTKFEQVSSRRCRSRP
jgi:hypothetical protein